jgi:peptide/nickel transport system ATP-binding protein
MRQRVTIAIALACGPSLLIADEPTTALDVTVQAQILDLLSTEQSKRSMALILVSHDLEVVGRVADEIIVMYAGRIVERAPTRVLFEQMKMPYTEALFRSLPRLSDVTHSDLMVIPGTPPDPTTTVPGCAFAPRCSYAQDKCIEERPVLEPGSAPGHEFACWFPVGTPVRVDITAAGRHVREASS